MMIVGSGTATGIYWWDDWVTDVILELGKARATIMASPIGVIYERIMGLGSTNASAHAYPITVYDDKNMLLGTARADALAYTPGIIYESIMDLDAARVQAEAYPITLKTSSQLPRPIGYTCVDISYYIDFIDILGG